MNRAAHVYAITHIATGDSYVGCSMSLRKRWNNHRSLLDQGKHHSARLQAAWSEHGPDAFSFSVLETIQNSTHEGRLWAEAKWAKKQGTFNTMPSEDGIRFTIRGADRIKRREIALQLIAADPEYRQFLSERGEALAEAIRSTEGRAAMSAHTKRRWKDPEERKKLEQGLINRWADPLARAKQSEKMSAARAKPEAKQRHTAAMRAAWADPNSGLNNRAQTRWADPEAKERQAQKMRDAWAKRRAAKS